MVEHRAVSVRLPEIVGPGIDVRIEVNQRGRAPPFRQRAQQRKGDAVIAAQGDEVFDLARLFLDQREAGHKVSERDGKVADVGHWQLRCIDPVLRMLAVHQHPAGLPNGARPKTCAAPVGRPEVERNSGNADRSGAIAATDAEKCRRNRVGRHSGHAVAARNRETEHGSCNGAGPVAIGSAFGRRRHRKTVDDEIAHFIDAFTLIPGRARIELDAERGGQHGRREILDIVPDLRLGHAEAMMLRDVAIMSWILRPSQTNSGGDPAARLVGFGARHDTERDFAGAQSGNPGRGRDEFTSRRQNRGDGDEVLLLDIRVAQRIFKCGEQVPVNADAAG